MILTVVTQVLERVANVAGPIEQQYLMNAVKVTSISQNTSAGCDVIDKPKSCDLCFLKNCYLIRV